MCAKREEKKELFAATRERERETTTRGGCMTRDVAKLRKAAQKCANCEYVGWGVYIVYMELCSKELYFF